MPESHRVALDERAVALATRCGFRANVLRRSLAFAKELRSRQRALHAEGVEDWTGMAITVAMIAWAATGHELSELPTGEESLELGKFIESHAEEINALAATGLAKLMADDCGPAIH